MANRRIFAPAEFFPSDREMGRRRFLLPFLILLGAMGCGLSGTENVASLSSSNTDNVVHLSVSSDPLSLDPAHATDDPSGRLVAFLYDGLVRFEGVAIVPCLAESWEIDSPGQTYTFRLRQDVRFHNGRRLTSFDVIHSFHRLLSPAVNSPRTWVLDRIAGASAYKEGETDTIRGLSAPNDYTVVIRLEEPFAPFLGLLAMPAASVVCPEEAERWGEDFSEHPCGTGPFVFSSWRHDDRVELTANNDYFGGAPHIDGITVHVTPEPQTALVKYRSGRLDVFEVPETEISAFRTEPSLNPYLETAPGLVTYYVALNNQRAPFNDPRVRLALNLALDGETILETVWESRGILANGPIPPSLPGHNHTRPPIPYDPERARALLVEAGIPDGFPITLLRNARRSQLDTCDCLEAYWEEIGLDVNVIPLEWSAFRAALNDGDYDAAYLNWVADYPDAENFLAPLFYSENFGSAGNRAYYSNPRFDRLIEEAVRTSDAEEWIELYHQAEEQVVRDVPWVFLWYATQNFAHSPRLRNYQIQPIFNAEKGLNWIIEEEVD